MFAPNYVKIVRSLQSLPTEPKLSETLNVTLHDLGLIELKDQMPLSEGLRAARFEDNPTVGNYSYDKMCKWYSLSTCGLL